MIFEAFARKNIIKKEFFELFLPFLKDFLRNNKINMKNLNGFIYSLSLSKIADDEVWYFLEQVFLKFYKKMSIHVVFSNILSFMKIKKGTPEFYN
jgi:hypothetical protein